MGKVIAGSCAVLMQARVRHHEKINMWVLWPWKKICLHLCFFFSFWCVHTRERKEMAGKRYTHRDGALGAGSHVHAIAQAWGPWWGAAGMGPKGSVGAGWVVSTSLENASGTPLAFWELCVLQGCGISSGITHRLSFRSANKACSGGTSLCCHQSLS